MADIAVVRESKGWSVRKGTRVLSTHDSKAAAMSAARRAAGGEVTVERSRKAGRFVKSEPSDSNRALRAAVRSKGQVTIPREVREALHVSEGDDVAFTVTGEGDVLLTGLKSIPADQAWFWATEWQAKEREADDDGAAGRYTDFETGEDFLAHIDKLTEHGADDE